MVHRQCFYYLVIDCPHIRPLFIRSPQVSDSFVTRFSLRSLAFPEIDSRGTHRGLQLLHTRPICFQHAQIPSAHIVTPRTVVVSAQLRSHICPSFPLPLHEPYACPSRLVIAIILRYSKLALRRRSSENSGDMLHPQRNGTYSAVTGVSDFDVYNYVNPKMCWSKFDVYIVHLDLPIS